MYEGKIVAEATVATPADVRADLPIEHRAEGSVALGVLVLAVAVPVMAVRVFVWAVVRDMRKLGTLAGIVGGAVRGARR